MGLIIPLTYEKGFLVTGYDSQWWKLRITSHRVPRKFYINVTMHLCNGFISETMKICQRSPRSGWTENGTERRGWRRMFPRGNRENRAFPGRKLVSPWKVFRFGKSDISRMSSAPQQLHTSWKKSVSSRDSMKLPIPIPSASAHHRGFKVIVCQFEYAQRGSARRGKSSCSGTKVRRDIWGVLENLFEYIKERKGIVHEASENHGNYFRK